MVKRLVRNSNCIFLSIMFDLEKLNHLTVNSAFQATIDNRSARHATLVDEDADLDSTVTHFNKEVTDTAAELLGKQRIGHSSISTYVQ